MNDLGQSLTPSVVLDSESHIIGVPLCKSILDGTGSFLAGIYSIA